LVASVSVVVEKQVLAVIPVMTTTAAIVGGFGVVRRIITDTTTDLLMDTGPETKYCVAGCAMICTHLITITTVAPLVTVVRLPVIVAIVETVAIVTVVEVVVVVTKMD